MAAPSTTNTYYKESEKRKFAEAVLTRLGAPVNEINVSAMLRWMQQEDGRSVQEQGTRAIAIERFNPLNTKWKSPNSVDSGGGVRAYNSFEQGVDATVKTLQSKNNDYSAVISAFKNVSGFDNLKTAISESPWGTFKGDAMTATGVAGSGSINVTSDIIARALLVNPDVAEVFKKYRGQQGDDVMQAIATDLKSTKWYQTNSERIRQVVLSSLSEDKATYNESRKNEIARIRKLALSIGATQDETQLDSLATQTLLFGLSEADLTTALVRSVRMDSNYVKGQAGTISQQLIQGITDFGFKVNAASPEFKTYVSDVLNGLRTVADVIGMFRDMASQQYPVHAPRFKAGATVASIANPYKYTMSNVLETPLDEIDLQDPNIQAALSSNMNTYEFSRTLKKDPRWQFTLNAQEELFSVFDKVLSQMEGIETNGTSST